MCNQSRHGRGRTHCLALFDVESGAIQWIRSGTTRRDFGITGIAMDDDGFYAAVQAHDDAIRIVWFHPNSFKILSEYSLKHTGDPHSLCIHSGQLMVASTSNNAIYCLHRKTGRISEEELYWRYPGTSETENDVHINSLASHDGELYATSFGPRDSEGKFGTHGELRNVTSDQLCLTNLHQPHSILFHNARVYCASSGSGEIVVATPTNEGWTDQRVKLRGYTRGLSAWRDCILVGVSAHRTRSRSKGNLLSHSDDHYANSEMVLLTEDAVGKRVVLDMTGFGREIYEILAVDIEPNTRLPRPVPFSRLESLRTNLERPF